MSEDITVELDPSAEDYQMDDEDASLKLKSTATKRRGRGFEVSQRDKKSDDYEILSSAGNELAQKSVEGWIIFVTGIHEEATEEHVRDKFADFGEIKSLHLNLDRQTGFVKGYSFIEYNTFEHAQEAINSMNGTDLLGKKIQCDWAFVKPPRSGRGGMGGGGGRRRGRSPSPDRR